MHKEHKAEEIKRISETFKIAPVIATILLNRGITEPDTFITPSENSLLDPFLMLGMEKGTERILKAISDGEKIAIYGDYDVDGITSTAIMVKFLQSHKADVIYYIPDRHEEGYGINMDAIDKIHAQGVSLLITVDCGITAVKEIAYAKELGIDTIITDHHECKEETPDAYCLINPKQPGCQYPFKRLAGVGVAFKLLQALTLKMHFHMRELIDEYIDLVAIGTIADVMPLVGENRIIVSSIKSEYTCEQLVGKKIIVVANLEPARIAGVESQGMLLAATNGACGCQVVFLPDCVPNGTQIK